MRHARIPPHVEHQDRLILRRLSVAVGWALVGAILWLSLTPQPPHVDFEQSDKVGHFIAYGGLMFWFCQLYRHARTGGFLYQAALRRHLTERLGVGWEPAERGMAEMADWDRRVRWSVVSRTRFARDIDREDPRRGRRRRA